jgi:hypothetical protein
MNKDLTSNQKDMMLHDAFSRLQTRGITSTWSKDEHPYTNLRLECKKLNQNGGFKKRLNEYLRVRSIVHRSFQMFFTSISMAARAKWDDAPDKYKPVTARGWFLGRWLPTFLIVDGPIGRLFDSDSSPFYKYFGAEFPILTAARDFLRERLFKLMRNGFAHWGFDWEVVGDNSYVIAYDWERDLPTAKLHQQEADAFHIITFALVEVIYDIFISTEKNNKDI